MKKFFIILQLVFLLFLCGCSKSDELGKNDIVISFFVDFDNYDKFKITAEILNFKNEEKAKIKTATGQTIETAFSELMNSLDNPPYCGHSGALILGDGLCVTRLSKVIKFFSNINTISPNINLMFTEDEFLDFNSTAVYNAVKNGSLPKMPLYTLFIPENKSSVIPVISEKNGIPENSGGVITENLKFKYYLNESLYETFKLLTNSYENKYYGSNEILNSECNIKNKNGKLEANLFLELNNLGIQSKDEIIQTTEKNIKNLTEELTKNKLCNILKKGEFQHTSINIKIKIPDTGKLKGTEIYD